MAGHENSVKVADGNFLSCNLVFPDFLTHTIYLHSNYDLKYSSLGASESPVHNFVEVNTLSDICCPSEGVVH